MAQTLIDLSFKRMMVKIMGRMVHADIVMIMMLTILTPQNEGMGILCIFNYVPLHKIWDLLQQCVVFLCWHPNPHDDDWIRCVQVDI